MKPSAVCPRISAPAAIGAALGLAVGGVASSAWAQADEERPPPEVGRLGEAHAVAPGDTLWDLCSQYLNSPWYWPKIWSYNPQLTNPHWIYPGNEIRFYPGDEELPTQVDVGRSLAVEDEDDLAVPGVVTEEDLVKTVGSIETGRTIADSVWTAFMGYISTDDLEKAGRLVNSTSESIMLMDGDRIYIEGRDGLKQGDRFAIYRAIRQISHPITGERYGYATQIVGAVEVVDTNPEVAAGRIIQAYRPVNRGDFVAPWPESYGTRIQPTPASSGAKGYILETAGDILGAVGEYHLVYVDRGREHGVQSGNVFDVYHRGDRYTGETEGLPNERVGKVMVVDVQDEASTAVIVNSNFELQVGDKVEMKPGT